MSSRRMQLFKCPVCDTVVEVLEDIGLELVCCGPAMAPLRERVAAKAGDEHNLQVERTAGGVRVRVGRQPHAAEEDHHIRWIELVWEGRCSRQFLRPGEAPEAEFPAGEGPLVARAYCSMHGLWKSKDHGQRPPVPWRETSRTWAQT